MGRGMFNQADPTSTYWVSAAASPA